jgi:hypothetical protein
MLDVAAEETMVGRAGVARMSAGHLHRLHGSTTLEVAPLAAQPTKAPSPPTREGAGGGENGAITPHLYPPPPGALHKKP